MIVFKHVPFWFLLKLNQKYLVYVFALSGLTYWLSSVLHIENPTILLPSMTVFGTVLSLFLAFRTNEAYNRWWEARILWGSMVNSSRSWAREVLAYINTINTQLDEEGLEKVQKSLIYRHLAFINAVRIHLRQQNTYSEELHPFLSDRELDLLDSYRNVPTQIINNQSQELRKIYKSDKVNGFEYVQMNNTLNALYDIQGGCERIKTTVFPRLYAYYTTAFTWVFSTVLILSLVDEFEWQTMAIRVIVAYVFLVLNELGVQLKNPFENNNSDTPMSSLCRTIEIDLKQMLGETNLPEPIKPVKGVLN